MNIEDWQNDCNLRIRELVKFTNETISWMRTGVTLAVMMGVAGLIMGVICFVKFGVIK